MLQHGVPVDRVLTLLLQPYVNLPEDATKAAVMVSAVRRVLLSSEDNIDPQYDINLERLLEHESLTEKDEQVILKLVDSNRFQQNRFHQQSRNSNIFSNPDLNDMFWAHSPLLPCYEEFRLPPEIADMSVYAQKQRARERLTNISPHYIISNETRQHIVEMCIEFAHSTFQITHKKEWKKAVLALGILSGRRNLEIIKSLTVYPVINKPFQAKITGLLKKPFQEDEQKTIPLLCEYAVFERLLWLMRHFWTPEGTPDEISHRISKGLLEKSIQWFDQKITHTIKRNIYADAAYERRQLNQFLQDTGKSYSRNHWIAAALGIYLEDRTLDRYQIIIDE